MDYQKQYLLLIRKVESQILPEETYTEKHHIVPKCCGGNNDKINLIIMLPEQHYVAHQLLAKIYKETPFYNKLIFAIQALGSMKKGKRNNKMYSWWKKEMVIIKKNTPVSEETKKKNK